MHLPLFLSLRTSLFRSPVAFLGIRRSNVVRSSTTAAWWPHVEDLMESTGESRPWRVIPRLRALLPCLITESKTVTFKHKLICSPRSRRSKRSTRELGLERENHERGGNPDTAWGAVPPTEEVATAGNAAPCCRPASIRPFSHKKTPTCRVDVGSHEPWASCGRADPCSPPVKTCSHRADGLTFATSALACFLFAPAQHQNISNCICRCCAIVAVCPSELSVAGWCTSLVPKGQGSKKLHRRWKPTCRASRMW